MHVQEHWERINLHMPAYYISDSKVRGANMGPIWGRQDPGGLHVGPMNFAIWDVKQLPMSAIYANWAAAYFWN